MPALNEQKLIGCLALAGAVALLASVSARASEYRTVRKTTGSVTITGWEKTLVRGNPNLSHFHWTPITSNVQGKELVLPLKEPNTLYIKHHPQKRHKSVYTKPRHIPTIISPEDRKASSEPYAHACLPKRNVQANIHYKHIPLPERNVEGNIHYEQAILPERDVESKVHYQHVRPGHYVQGKLKNRQVEARLARETYQSEKASPKILSYSEAYGKVKSYDTDAHLYAKDVYGSIKGARPF